MILKLWKLSLYSKILLHSLTVCSQIFVKKLHFYRTGNVTLTMTVAMARMKASLATRSIVCAHLMSSTAAMPSAFESHTTVMERMIVEITQMKLGVVSHWRGFCWIYGRVSHFHLSCNLWTTVRVISLVAWMKVNRLLQMSHISSHIWIVNVL